MNDFAGSLHDGPLPPFVPRLDEHHPRAGHRLLVVADADDVQRHLARGGGKIGSDKRNRR
jgi:hypothetical protein